MNQLRLSIRSLYFLSCLLFSTAVAGSEAPLMEVNLVPKTYNGGYHLTCYGANDGFIETVVTDGTAPYTYSWSSGNTTQNLEHATAGTYTVTVTDANGVTASASIELLQPKLLEVEATSKLQEGGTHISKAGGSDGTARAEVLGGTPPYTYLWATTDGTADANASTKEELYDLGAGTYTVTVEDVNGCSETSSIALTEPTPLTAALAASTQASGHHISCAKGEDGAIDLTVSGGIPPYKYDWSSGHFTEDVTGLRAGYHEVRITDANGTEFAIGETLTEPDPIDVVLSSPLYPNGYNVSCHSCYNGTVNSTVTGGAGGYVYNWEGPSGSAGNTANLTSAGEKEYNLTVTDANGCKGGAEIPLKLPERDDWTMNGNAGIGPDQFIGTTDANDLVLKANNQPQLRLGSDGVTEVTAALKASGLNEIVPDEANSPLLRLLVADPEGNVSFVHPGPHMPWEGPHGVGCWDVFNASLMGQWNYDINKIMTCPPIDVGIGTDEPLAKLDVRDGSIMVGYAPAYSAPFTNAALDVKGKTVISYQNGVGPTFANAMLDVRANGNEASFTIETLDNNGLSSFRVRNNGKVVVNNGQFEDPAIEKASLFVGNEIYSLSSIPGFGIGLSATNNGTLALYVPDNSHHVNIPNRLHVGATQLNNGPHADYKLCVDGKIVAKEVVVTTDDVYWPDYVFEEDYTIQSLETVQEFVENHHHLPSIPSAASIQESGGVELKKMNVMLLKEIEHLYLQMFLMKEEIECLKQEFTDY